MTTYALLPRASANRVYGTRSLELVRAELLFIDRVLFDGVMSNVDHTQLGGVDYILVDCGAGTLDDFQIDVISNLSGLHAMFVLRNDALVPVSIRPRAAYDDDILTIPRYVGKTNEQFTQLLINVTLAACNDGFGKLLEDRQVRLLDPVCGRGTSLNQAVVYGMDAFGVEIDQRDFDAYTVFIQTWLKDKRIKHKVERATLRRGRSTSARRLSISYGKERKGLRRQIEMVNDDTVTAGSHFKRRSMDVVVADLPYGVQHETRAASGRVSRRPEELLETALPVWAELLRVGGAMGLSWNLKTLDRSRLFELLQGVGLEPRQDHDDGSFVHKVDRAITRDLLVATRILDYQQRGTRGPAERPR